MSFKAEGGCRCSLEWSAFPNIKWPPGRVRIGGSGLQGNWKLLSRAAAFWAVLPV